MSALFAAMLVSSLSFGSTIPFHAPGPNDGCFGKGRVQNQWVAEVPDEDFNDVVAKLRTTPGVEVLALETHSEISSDVVFKLDPQEFANPKVTGQRREQLLSELRAESLVNPSCKAED